MSGRKKKLLKKGEINPTDFFMRWGDGNETKNILFIYEMIS